ncbi:MAG: tetratricopeptide repeat protein [Flavobacteriales bacterium]|nr:tetratricopeptide repeat protein [Flavobacteriales bacterium]
MLGKLGYKIFMGLALALLFFTGVRAQDPWVAKSYLDNGEFDKAAVVYEKLHEREPAREEYYQALLACYQALGRGEEMEKVLRRQVRRFPKEALYLADLGLFLKKNGDAKNGQARLEDALKVLTPRPDYVEKLAGRFLRAGEYDLALRAYEMGEKALGPGTFSMAVAEVYLEKQDWKSAAQQLIRYVEMQPGALNTVKTALSTWLDDNPVAPFNRAMQSALIQRMQTSSSVELADILIWLLLHQKDYDMAIVQARALDKRLKENGERLYELGNTFAEARQYDLAIQCYEYVMNQGASTPLWLSAKYALAKALLARAREKFPPDPQDFSKLVTLFSDLARELPPGDESFEALLTAAEIRAMQLNQPQESAEILRRLADNHSLKPQHRAKAKLLLADVLLLMGEIWEPTLLYGQVEKDFKNDGLGAEAKFRNARLAFFRGEFEYAQMQMEALKASTSKLTANDAIFLSLIIIENLGVDSVRAPLEMFARAELLAWQKRYDQALLTLDSLSRLYPERDLADEVLMRKGEIFLQFGKVGEATVAFEELIQKYPRSRIADGAVFRLAELEEFYRKDPEKAKMYYEKILSDYPGSLYTAEARKRYRQLRGDKLN